MEKPFIEIDSEHFAIQGFYTKPVEGYEAPKNFPNCCDYHKHVLEIAETFFNQFPNCCKAHKKLINKPWFKKEMYSGLPSKIVSQLSFTEYHISHVLDKPDWFEDIVDYIEWNVTSFGHPAVGLHVYLGNLKHYLKGTKSEIPNEKRKRIAEFVDEYYKPVEKTSEKLSLNVLYETYQKWIKTFPFEVSFFKELKMTFAKKLPIISGIPTVNRYSGVAKAKMLTKRELAESLVTTTKNLLQSVSSVELLNKGLITDVQTQQVEFISESHKITQTSLLNDFCEEEGRYLAVIKQWLKNEKKYFKEIVPIIKRKINRSVMAKNFDLEVRETFKKPYLKVFIKDISRLNEVSAILSGLSSVRKVNISESKASGSPERNLTVYPSRVHDISETKQEVEFTLNNFYAGSKADPLFETEAISVISDRGYSQIIERILTFGKNLEKFQSLYHHFDEENFRDFFLPHLNSISSRHTSTGETFNKRGKTDILIQDTEGNNVFIAECKLWKGQSELKNAVDQLLERYVNWRDEKVALIFFNKDVKGFSEVIAKAIEALKEHSHFDSYLGNRKDTSHPFIFKHPEDIGKKIKLELILFNCTS